MRRMPLGRRERNAALWAELSHPGTRASSVAEFRASARGGAFPGTMSHSATRFDRSLKHGNDAHKGNANETPLATAPRPPRPRPTLTASSHT